ncbi:hypothetical protein CMV_013856 [Castanea mollissima]|uniref:Transposase n=1 Tax=Castanea mollissima TaxID=60419 RepID=A0A8J4VHS0_9ROSI|nr:hypothetical protein CMV_013856 [Castanea mollissima]
MRGIVIRDVSVRSSQQASNENVDHESQQEIGQSSTVNPSITVVPLPVRATRGPSKYSFIWNLPENHKIELPLTSSNQPIQQAGRHFSGWLGTIARKPHLCPIKYKNWTEIPDELKEEIWDIVQSKWILPEEPARLKAMKNRTLSSIATYWRNHKSTLKKKYFLGRGNRARAPPNVIQEDYEAIVQHWSLQKTKVTTLGKPVERADVYVKLHLRKDGTPVNAEAQSNIEKINELLSESSNRVQSSDLTGSISWAPDDVYAQVFGNERNGRVRGVGFGPTPSMHPAKSTPAIAQEQVTQLMQLVQNQQNHSSEASRGGFGLDRESPTPYRSQASSHQEASG